MTNWVRNVDGSIQSVQSYKRSQFWDSGIYNNDEYRNKISESNRKNPRVKNHSEETKEKQRKASTGRLQSDETKKKRSESIKKWWAEKKLSQDP